MEDNGVSRRSLLKAGAWSVPVVAASVAAPAAAASLEPFEFGFTGTSASASVLYPDYAPIPSERLTNAVLFSGFSIFANETNTSDITVTFTVGQSASGHTNYLGNYTSAVGVYIMGSANPTAWTEGTRTYNSLPVTSQFVLPAGSLSLGSNDFPLTWRLTDTELDYVGPFGSTGMSFVTSVDYEGEELYRSVYFGQVVDSTVPVQVNYNDIWAA